MSVQNTMVSVQTKAKFAALQLAYFFGKKASDYENTFSGEIYELEKSMKKDVIKSSTELEMKRVGFLSGLVEQIKANAKEGSQCFRDASKAVSDVEWSSDAKGYAERYETIVKEAYAAGEEIFDTCITIAVKFNEESLDEIMENIAMSSMENNFAVRTVCKGFDFDNKEFRSYVDNVGTIEVYTSAVGARFLVEIPKLSCNWDHYSVTVCHYTISKTTPDINTILMGQKGERDCDLLDSSGDTLAGIQMRDASLQPDSITNLVADLLKSSTQRQGVWFNFVNESDDEIAYTIINEILDTPEYGFDEEALKLLRS